jgi:O-antigen ligase
MNKEHTAVLSELGPEPMAAAPSGRRTDIFQWALILFFIIEVVRPQDLFPPLGALRPGMLISGFLLVLLLRYRPKPPLHPLLKGVLAFIVVMGVNIPFAAHRFYAYQATWQAGLLFASVLLPLYYFPDSLDKLGRLIHWFLALSGIQALIVIKNGGTGVGSWLHDENDVCLLLVVAFAMAMFLWLGQRSTKARVWLGLLIALYLVGIVATASRGGFLALVAVNCWIGWLSPRRVLFVVIAGLLIIVLLFTVPTSYVDEMSTISQSTQGRDTGAQRLYLWGLALKMFASRPITGWGPYGYEHAAYLFQGEEQFGLRDEPITRTAWGKSVHSVYFTVLAELGLLGSLVFLWLLYRAFRGGSRLRRRLRVLQSETAEEDARLVLRQIQYLSLALTGALLAFLMAGFFLSALYYPIFWILLALNACLARISQSYLAEPQAETPQEGAV